MITRFFFGFLTRQFIYLTVFSDFGKGEENADRQRNVLSKLPNDHKDLQSTSEEGIQNFRKGIGRSQIG